MRQIKKVFRRVDTQADGQTDGAGPTSSISWLQEGMAGGKMQQNLGGRGEKNVQSFQNHRGRSADMSKQNKKKRQPEEIII